MAKQAGVILTLRRMVPVPKKAGEEEEEEEGEKEKVKKIEYEPQFLHFAHLKSADGEHNYSIKVDGFDADFRVNNSIIQFYLLLSTECFC